MRNLSIGWARRDITPTSPVALYGWAIDRFTSTIRDALSVTALAIDRGQGQDLILLSCDLLWIDQELMDAIRERVARRLPDWDAKHLVICATHTHNAPFTSAKQLLMPWGALRNYAPEGRTQDYLHPSEYQQFLFTQLTDAAVSAWQTRSPGGISSGYDRLSIGQNRRVVYDDGSVQMYGDTRNKNFASFEGPEDNAVELLYTWNANQQLTGVAVHICCPSQTLESQLVVSADYWAEVRMKLTEQLGESVYLLPLLGPSGDVIPHDIIRGNHQRIEVPANEIAFHHRQRNFNAELKRIARHIVFSITESLPSARDLIDYNPHVEHHVQIISLPLRRVSKHEADGAKQQYEDWKQRLQADPIEHYTTMSRHERFILANLLIMIHHYQRQQSAYPLEMELHIIRLGDIAITTNPFELYTDYGLQIKANSAAKQTLNIQLSCGHAGYLPTEKAVLGGSYGALIFNGPVGPDGGRLLVDHTVACIHQLWSTS